MQTDAVSPTLPEHVVRPLCQPFSGQADCILDLYAMTQTPPAPGQCVQCFFKLLGNADPAKTPALTPLRQWIEENIEIAIQAGDAPAGTLPVYLEAEDMENFCYQAIQRVRQDTAIRHPRVELEFHYKDAVRAV